MGDVGFRSDTPKPSMKPEWAPGAVAVHPIISRDMWCSKLRLWTRSKMVKHGGCPRAKLVVCIVDICRGGAAQRRRVRQQKIGRGKRTVIVEGVANRNIAHGLHCAAAFGAPAIIGSRIVN